MAFVYVAAAMASSLSVAVDIEAAEIVENRRHSTRKHLTSFFAHACIAIAGVENGGGAAIGKIEHGTEIIIAACSTNAAGGAPGQMLCQVKEMASLADGTSPAEKGILEPVASRQRACVHAQADLTWSSRWVSSLL